MDAPLLLTRAGLAVETAFPLLTAALLALAVALSRQPAA